MFSPFYVLYCFILSVYLSYVASQVYVLTAIAGTGTASSSGDGSPAISVPLNKPRGIWLDSHGNLYIVEVTGYKIRKVNTLGIISTLIGTGSTSMAGTGGVATSVSFPILWGIYGDNRTIYFSDNEYFIWSYNFSSNWVSRIAGSLPANGGYSGDGGPATLAKLNKPYGLFLSSSGSLFVTDRGNHRIRCINVSSTIITTFAGNGTGGYRGDNRKATLTTLQYPFNVWGNTLGVVFIADYSNHRVRYVDTSGIIRTLAGTGVLASTGDGAPASLAAVYGPSDVKGDSLGNIFISEYDGCRLRRISISGIISTVIGTGTCTSPTITGLIASTTTIGNVKALWIHGKGGIYVTENNYVRYLVALPPTAFPSSYPSTNPSTIPTLLPTVEPSAVPTPSPSTNPSTIPTLLPTVEPSAVPTPSPSITPTVLPSFQSTTEPSTLPSTILTPIPTLLPTAVPSMSSSIFSLFPSQLSSGAPSSSFISCVVNDSSWKSSLFLFGLFSYDFQNSKVLDPSPVSASPSSIIFGSKSLSSSFSSSQTIEIFSLRNYPVAETSSSYKRDVTSRAAVIPGDVNGDLYNDLIICSPLFSSCSIFFGRPEDGLRNVMSGVTIYGSSSQSTANFFGFAVAGIGDVNKDGVADLIVSALTYRACYVIYGRKSWPMSIRLSDMKKADGYRIIADSSTTLTGISVAGVGDMNGDGRDDMAISAQRGGLFVVYVIWGDAAGNDVILSEVRNGVNGFKIVGEQGYYTGLSITGVGDVNGDNLADLVVGAIPFPDRTKSQEQRSYAVLGSSSPSINVDREFGSGESKGIVTIVGGGFIVSGPGDLNGDGIEDVMITGITDYLNKGNSYLISYPSKMSSPPSYSPSSFPSSIPSHFPSSQPSSASPSNYPSFATSQVLTPSPNQLSPSTNQPSKLSARPSDTPTRIPTITATSTKGPSQQPTLIQTKHKPSLIPITRTNPSFSPSSSGPTPTFAPLTNTLPPSPLSLPSSQPLALFQYNLRLVNSSGLNKYDIVYGVEDANERFEISSLSNDGKRRSGWSGTIIAGKGSKIYVIYPKDPSQPVNKIILQDFDRRSSVIDLSHMSQIASKEDLSYLTNPLTLFLPDNQKIVISSYKTMSDLYAENFAFQLRPVSSSSSNSPSNDLYIAIGIFGAMMIIIVSLNAFFFNPAEKSKEKKNESDNVAQITENIGRLREIEEGRMERADSLHLDQNNDNNSTNREIDGYLFHFPRDPMRDSPDDQQNRAEEEEVSIDDDSDLSDFFQSSSSNKSSHEEAGSLLSFHSELSEQMSDDL